MLRGIPPFHLWSNEHHALRTSLNELAVNFLRAQQTSFDQDLRSLLCNRSEARGSSLLAFHRSNPIVITTSNFSDRHIEGGRKSEIE